MTGVDGHPEKHGTDTLVLVDADRVAGMATPLHGKSSLQRPLLRSGEQASGNIQ